jgi:hypothetical protein
LFGIERKKKRTKTKAPLQFQGGDDSKDEVNPSFCSFPTTTTTTTKNINRTVSYVMSKMHFKVEKSFKIRFLKRYIGI